MQFEVYNKNKSNLKVAFFSKKTFGTALNNDININRIAEYNKLEIHLFDTDNDEFSNFKSFKEHKKLDKKGEVVNIYKYIEYLKNNQIKICIFFGSGYPWTSRFLEKVKKISYTACYFGDDPEGCETTSKYYVKNYNYAFCGGIYFDEKTRIEEKYVEWGARKSKFIPLGLYPTKYREKVNDFKNRPIDLIYVGGCYFPKVFRMFKLKKHFGDRMRMYGCGWNTSRNLLKTLILRFLKFIYGIPEIKAISDDELIELYQNSKIGFNLHMSYGPSNIRMYELPANGVMQICDCEKGLQELYEIDKEVVSYKNINEAIRKIEYYLKNDEERIKIAKAGYEKALDNYRIEKSFEKIISTVLDDYKNLKLYI